ncbi:hypothetical protein LZ012_11360 [Dechloromonas sp. XY25]|uniref:Uncharacterized protein n=1 Tax=Dechloromonas hankyongensis TaxID=2908002 RepID=A0ABS9K363_9RHOO|nr:hypothetical protein [Dechloromonas hankyongensis]MCG2577590.1 hypothetical protein [Dechloromonas hankyongensis]
MTWQLVGGYVATFIAGSLCAYIVYRLAVDEQNRQKTESDQEWLERQW